MLNDFAHTQRECESETGERCENASERDALGVNFQICKNWNNRSSAVWVIWWRMNVFRVVFHSALAQLKKSICISMRSKFTHFHLIRRKFTAICQHSQRTYQFIYFCYLLSSSLCTHTHAHTVKTKILSTIFFFCSLSTPKVNSTFFYSLTFLRHVPFVRNDNKSLKMSIPFYLVFAHNWWILKLDFVEILWRICMIFVLFLFLFSLTCNHLCRSDVCVFDSPNKCQISFRQRSKTIC